MRHCKYLLPLFILLFLGVGSLQAQLRIDSASVDWSTQPESLYVTGRMANNFVERVEMVSISDAYNTQQVHIYFGVVKIKRSDGLITPMPRYQRVFLTG